MSYWSRNHVIVPHTLNFTFNLDIESTDKTLSIANKLDGAFVKKKVLMLGLKGINAINNRNIYDTYNIP